MKHVAAKTLRRLGVEVRRLRKHPDLNAFLAHHGVQVVYDIGANVGQFGQKLRRLGYAGRIVSYEPVQSVYVELAAISGTDSGWQAARGAVGSQRGKVNINVSINSEFSSIKPLSQKAARIDPESSFGHVETVDAFTLDDIVVGDESYLIKIDTQGFEQEILAGGKRSVTGAAGILMELPVINLYENVWTLHEAVAHMRELGFVLCQIEPVGYHPLDPMAVIEFDCLFRRHRHGID
jgi:FkbM family methyltransferase